MSPRVFPQAIDSRSGVPLRVQLREGVLAAIGDGRLPPGARLPTMRALAAHLAVDLNTVQRAYAELERLGAIETRRARGSFVAATPPAPDPAQTRMRVDAAAAAAIATARAQGLSPQAVAAAMLTILERGDSA